MIDSDFPLDGGPDPSIKSGVASESHSARIEKLEKQVTQLSLIVEVLWDSLAADKQLTNQALFEQIELVRNNRQGRSSEKIQCTKCKMTLPALRDKCMYCGEILEVSEKKSPFDV